MKPKSKPLSVLLFFFFLIIMQFCKGQHAYKSAVIAFYNLENFYDTLNNPATMDEEFTPSGEKHYSGKIYFDKIEKLASVIVKIGTDKHPANADGPALLGVAEIENDTVLTDLIQHPLLVDKQYSIVHYDSKDSRGVDVALLYNPKYFHVEESAALFVDLFSATTNGYYTRDILWIKGNLDGETIHVYVNHWPSRLGGEERSASARAAAAQVCKKHIDSIRAIDGEQKVILMGDLNDDPTSPSVRDVLKAKANPNELTDETLFNPWINLYKNGIGTLAYRDAWGLFDQIMLSRKWINKDQNGFFFYQAQVFNREFISENKGRYKGYPMRTWDGNTYRGGYSDHFPTYIILLKK